MKTKKLRKMARAIASNKASKNIDAKRLTDMQSVVAGNKYKHDRKLWNDINKSFQSMSNGWSNK